MGEAEGERRQADYHLAARSYSALSPCYHDWSPLPWDENMRRQGNELARLLPSLGCAPPAAVLDFTAGMGTQPIALALHGYRPTALDLSPAQIARARGEARRHGVEDRIAWIEGDALAASRYASTPFDAVLSFGNSLPLLGSRENILAVLVEMRKLLRAGGVLLLSVSDYTGLLEQRPHIMQSGRVDNDERKGTWLETAQWISGTRQYVSDVYFVYTEPEQRVCHYPFAALYALTDDDLAALLQEAGYTGYEYYPRAAVPALSCPLHVARVSG